MELYNRTSEAALCRILDTVHILRIPLCDLVGKNREEKEFVANDRIIIIRPERLLLFVPNPLVRLSAGETAELYSVIFYFIIVAARTTRVTYTLYLTLFISPQIE